ncbi:hypothetical protein MPH_09328, partial [Macrophomina phaseolina MS6]
DICLFHSRATYPVLCKMPCDICYFDFKKSFSPTKDEARKHSEAYGNLWLNLSDANVTKAISRGCWTCRMVRDAVLPFNRNLPGEWHCRHNDLGYRLACMKCATSWQFV